MTWDIFFGTDGLEKESIERVFLPGKETSFCDREFRFDDISLEKCRRRPESMTACTGTTMRIEREVGNRQLIKAIVTYRTIRME